MIPGLFITFSTETTGLITQNAKGELIFPDIISFGAVLVDQGSIIDTMTIQCKPTCPIQEDATRKHGARESDLEALPPFSAIADEITAYLDPGIPLITHASDFHWLALKAQFDRCGIAFDRPEPLCISKLCKTSDADDSDPGPSLFALKRLAGLESLTQVDNRLDASVDAKDIAEIALFLEREYSDFKVAS
ncbi:3'-5' exonuclease [Reinekea sp. G2M2-21]|uniref:3'-5' exonuclease n=1 Tax=Reinekea sp. G2M2-21 TaxID=2788942 RepID=UPI0018AB647D|nr:3'-5' exonuclease [Reinekea sp. G2M2-21]